MMIGRVGVPSAKIFAFRQKISAEATIVPPGLPLMTEPG